MTGAIPRPTPLFITPTLTESAAVRQGLKKPITRGDVQLMMCGVGEINSFDLIRNVTRSSISCLILIGWGGGLSAGLAPGDVVCADLALREGQPAVECAHFPVENSHSGPILTVREALLTPTDKLLAGKGGAFAVEMEAYPLAAWALEQTVPFYHFRVILDTLDETLPDLGDGMTLSGKLRLFPLLKKLLKQPSLVRELWCLYQRVRALDPILGNLADEVFQKVSTPSGV